MIHRVSKQFVKVKPQPKRRDTNVLCVFNINWNIFKWRNTVNPDETTEDEEEDNYTAEQEDNDTAEQEDNDTAEQEDNDTAEQEEEPEIGIEINLDIVWDDVLPYFE
jgi:hypothetical protein